MTPYQQAMIAVLDWASTKPLTPSKDAARVYVEAMPQAEQEGLHFHNSAAIGRATQILYILSNIQHWRGDIAKESKEALRQQYNLDKGHK